MMHCCLRKLVLCLSDVPGCEGRGLRKWKSYEGSAPEG